MNGFLMMTTIFTTAQGVNYAANHGASIVSEEIYQFKNVQKLKLKLKLNEETTKTTRTPRY